MINSEKDNNKIEIILDSGEKKAAEIVFAFSEAGEDYIVYELEGKTFAGAIDDKNNIRVLDDRENYIVEEIYNEFLDDQEEEK